MNNKGFTIVETLIAITILMIAISGPLVVASKGLTGSIIARDQMIASYLAEESMDTIKNMRDNNVSQGSSWLTGFSVSSTCNVGHTVCDASAIDSPALLTASGSAYPLVLLTDGYYSHNTGTSGARATIFSRYFYFTAPGSASACSEASNECSVQVIVSWTEGTVPYQVALSSELFNIGR